MTTLVAPVVVLPRSAYARGKAGRRRWLAERRNGVGGSDAAAVLGLSPWESPLSLWVDKRRSLVDNIGDNPAGAVDDDVRSEAMRWGTVLEQAIARELAREHGVRLAPTPGIVAHPDRPWQRMTADNLAVDRAGAVTALVEVKTANAFAAGEWCQDGPPPDHVVIQVQHGLDVYGLDLGYVAALVGGNQPRWWPVERDDGLIVPLREAEDAFWRMVQAGVPPAPIGHDADGDALAGLYPGDPGRQAVLDGEALAHLSRLLELKAELKWTAEQITFAEQQVKAALGDATEGLRPDGTTAVTWRPQNTTRLDSTALKAARPQTWQEFATTTTTRVLRVKKETG